MHTFGCTIKLCRFIGSRSRISRFADGSLLAKLATTELRARKRGLRTLDGMPVNVVLHFSLNFVKNVMYSQKILRYSAEKLTEEFANQGLVKVKRV